MQNEPFYIGTTRFNDTTWEENCEWRRRHRWEGCVYGANKRMPKHVPRDALVYVLEMNNQRDMIMGIGLVRNFFDGNRDIWVYKSEPDYNRFFYHSRYRRDRDDIENKKMLAVLELMVFKGYGHNKRGQSITTIPWKRFKGPKTKRIIRRFLRGLFPAALGQ